MLIAASLSFVTAACWADSPLVTEEADVQAAGICEFETMAGQQRHPREKTASAQFGCGFGFNSELSIGASKEISSDPDVNYLAFNGKTAIQHLTQDQSGISVAYTILGSKERSNDLKYASAEIKGVITVPYQDWLFHANAGVLHIHGRSRLATWGVAAEWLNAMDSIDWMAEAYGDSKSNPWMQVGVRWNAVPDMMIFSFAYGVQTNQDRCQAVTIGVKVAFQ